MRYHDRVPVISLRGPYFPSYGITAFDTSRYYGESEVVLGEALKAVADEFPRESYQIVRIRRIQRTHPSYTR